MMIQPRQNGQKYPPLDTRQINQFVGNSNNQLQESIYVEEEQANPNKFNCDCGTVLTEKEELQKHSFECQ